MFNNKRGTEPVDWTIAVALFLIYLGWFFVFVRPALYSQADDLVLNEKIYNKIYNYATISIKEVPLFIETNYLADFLFIETGLNGEKGNFVASDSLSANNQDSLFLIKNLTLGRNYEMIYFEDYLKRQKPSFDLVSTPNFSSVDTYGFKAEFESGVIKRAYFNDLLRIKGIQIEIDSLPMDQIYFNFSNKNACSVYESITSSVWLTTLVPAQNSEIIMYAKKPLNQDHAISFSINLSSYSNYFFDQNNTDEIVDNESACWEGNGKKIDLYSGINGVLFLLNKTASFRLCNYFNDNNNRSDLLLNISLNLDQDTKIGIYFHDGGIDSIEALQNPYSYYFGEVNSRKGFSWNKLKNLTSLDYQKVKKDFEMNNNTDFFLFLTNSTSSEYLEGKGEMLFSFGMEKPTNIRVASKVVEENMIDETGSLIPITLIINSWSKKS